MLASRMGTFMGFTVPTLASRCRAGYASEGPDGYSPHRRTGQRLFFKSTVPVPFQFEEREKQRPKTIAKVCLGWQPRPNGTV